MKTILFAFTLVLAGISAATQPGTLDTTFKTTGGPNGSITAIARQKDGKVLIGGTFTAVNSAPRGNIARLLSSGTVDLTFNPGTGFNGPVHAIVVQTDGKILVGGSFTTFNGITCSSLVRLNANGSLDLTYKRGTLDGQVRALALQNDGRILVGGTFSLSNGVSRNSLSRRNTDGSEDLSFSPLFGSSTTIHTLHILTGGKILAAGTFTSYALASATHIIKLNADGQRDITFTPPLMSGSGFTSTAVQKDGRIIAVGEVIVAGEMFTRRIARFSTDGNLDTTYATSTTLDSTVNVVGLQTDGKAILGGNFLSVSGTSAARLARLKADGTLDTSYQSGSGPSSAVTALHVHTDNKTLIGGTFTSYNGSGRAHIARILSSGLVDSAFNSASNATQFRAVAVQADGKVLLGGDFTTYNGLPRNRLVRLKTDGTLDTTFIIGSGADAPVNAIALQPDGKILVAGEFSNFNSQPHSGLTRLNPDGTVDTAFDIGDGAEGAGIVNTILLQPDGKILVGGQFSDFDNGSSSGIARLLPDGSLDPTFLPGNGTTGVIRTLALRPDGRVLAGGSFTTFASGPASNLVCLSPSGPVDTSFDTAIGGPNAPVRTLALLPDGDIIIGGDFTLYRTATRNRLARVNPNGTLDSSFDPGPGTDIGVTAIFAQPDEKVVAVGGFSTARGQQRNSIVRFTAEGTLDPSFHIGSGADQPINAITVQPDGKLLIAGDFNDYNGAAATGVARLLQTYAHTAATFTGITTAEDTSLSTLFGKVSLTLTATGSFTGSITLGTEKVTLTGSFNRDGVATITAVRKDKSLLYINLSLRRGANGGAMVQGQVQDLQARRVSLLAHAPYFSSTTRPAGHFSGKHLISLINDNTAQGTLPPSGHGYLTATVSTTGSVTLVGRAPDGTVLSTSVKLGEEGHLLLHLPLYTSKGFINGSITITEYEEEKPSSGILLWSRPTSTTYPTGFLAELEASGSLYLPAPTGQPPISGSLTLAITGGHLVTTGPSVADGQVTFGANNVGIIGNTTMNSLKISINRSAGTFSGSFIPPGLSKAATFYGILHYATDGYGYILITIGGVTLPSSVLLTLNSMSM